MYGSACVCMCVCVCFSKNWFTSCNWFALAFNTFASCGWCVLALFLCVCVAACVLGTPSMDELILMGLPRVITRVIVM